MTSALSVKTPGLMFTPVHRPDLCAVAVDRRADGMHEVLMIQVDGIVLGTPTVWASLGEALSAAAAMLPSCECTVSVADAS